MTKAYSIDLREKIIESYENNEGSIRKLAKRFKVSKEFILKLLKRFKETGSSAPKPYGGGRSPAIKKEGQDFIKGLLKDQPDLILDEICNEYNKHFAQVSRSTIARTLNRMMIIRKKNFTRSKTAIKAK